MLGSSNKTVAEVRACFDLAAADISDLVCSFSCEFMVSGLWSLVSGLWSLVSGSSFEWK